MLYTNLYFSSFAIREFSPHVYVSNARQKCKLQLTNYIKNIDLISQELRFRLKILFTPVLMF